MSYASCPGLSLAISAQFTFKMCVAAENRKKFTKTPYFENSKSFKVIDINTSKKLATIACYDKQHVCACQLRQNNHFGGFDARLRRSP